jgi:hypothetical protein
LLLLLLLLGAPAKNIGILFREAKGFPVNLQILSSWVNAHILQNTPVFILLN